MRLTWKKLMRGLPHLNIILSAMFLVLVVLNDYNPAMNFILHPVSLALLVLFCLASSMSSIMTINKLWQGMAEETGPNQEKEQLT